MMADDATADGLFDELECPSPFRVQPVPRFLPTIGTRLITHLEILLKADPSTCHHRMRPHLVVLPRANGQPFVLRSIRLARSAD